MVTGGSRTVQPAQQSPRAGAARAVAPGRDLAGDSPYRAALAALDTFGQAARGHGQALQALEAQLTVHGFDHDPAVMTHIQGLTDLAAQASARAERARQVLAEHHAAGDEYHTTGVDAGTSAFRTT